MKKLLLIIPLIILTGCTSQNKEIINENIYLPSIESATSTEILATSTISVSEPISENIIYKTPPTY